MFQEKYVFRRCIWLLATAWCAATPLAGIAGRPATPEENAALAAAAASKAAAGPVLPSTPTSHQLAANDLLPTTTDLLARADAAKEPITGPGSPSQNVTVNLINRLVERGVLTKQDSQDLIRLAEEDAAVAHAQAATVEHDVAVAREAAQAAVQQTAPPVTDDQVRVTYIPESVKAQMREEIKEEVLSKARAENWAAPNAVPDWVPRFRVAGDIRVRYEGDFFPEATTTRAPSPFSIRSTPAHRLTSVAPSSHHKTTWTRTAIASASGRGSARRSAWTMALPSACGSAAARTTVRSPKTKPSVCRTTGKAETSASIRSGSTARS